MGKFCFFSCFLSECVLKLHNVVSNQRVAITKINTFGESILTIQDVCASFDIGGKYQSCKELGTGNINSTFHVRYIRDGEKKHYIVQRINKHVFSDPERLMDNIVRVTHYVRENIKKMGFSTKRFVLRVFLTKEGKKPFFVDNFGNYWRVYRYIQDCITYDSCDDLNIIERSGQAFGRFQNCLDGFDASSLYIPIPDFHNTPKRFENFYKTIEADVEGRVASVRDEIEKLRAFEEKASKLQTYLDNGEIPLRVTHNDTKCNNVSFDMYTGEALAVLDLDTVMPGAVAYDFGDAIRFIANTCLEDDPDVDSVKLDLNKYEAFAKGFLSELKDKLTDKEKQTMNLGVLTMAVELAVRFLDDYIAGDKYFKVSYPGHNLDRARNQIALATDVATKLEQMDKIIEKYL